MAHNEDSDPIDDDDQHVHPWQPNNPPQIASSTLDQPSSSHPVNTSVWEMVSQHHHEVC
jgi:hypothetical protein